MIFSKNTKTNFDLSGNYLLPFFILFSNIFSFLSFALVNIFIEFKKILYILFFNEWFINSIIYIQFSVILFEYIKCMV